MKDLVKIKSLTNSITLILDPDARFQDICVEINSKFNASRAFFKNASVGLCFEGRELTNEEEEEIVDIIQNASDIKIICLIVNKSMISEAEYHTLLRNINKKEVHPVFIQKNVLTGETINSDSDLIVYGNVCSGATLKANGSVIVYGSLFGTVYAGCDDRTNAFITALELKPEEAYIGECEYIEEKSSSLFKKKNKIEPSTLFKKGNRIELEVIKDL